MEKNSKPHITPSGENESVTFKTKYIKYPFSGVASNLIDKFLVLAYDQKDIEYTLQTQELKQLNIKNYFLQYVEFQERPTIVNEICHDYQKESQENDLILQIIFPNCPRLYFLDKNHIKDQKDQFDFNEEANNYSIIFSINPQDSNSSKKSFNGLGSVFHIKKEYRSENGELNGLIYYPITYVILSEYPFYYHFNKICKNIYIQMKKKTDEIPIDIILYNVIKYCPSPINVNLNLSFGAQLSANPNNKITHDDVILQLSSTNKSEVVNGIPFLFFNQLSGYPIMDINMSFLFNLLEPQMIIRTFVLTFLELDVIFFSAVPEILNTVMYIFANLNYPFNDSIYYWHVVSLSEYGFMKDTDSPFTGKVSSSMYGICCEYNPDMETTKKVKEHFILNIDEKNLSILYSDDTDQEKLDRITDLDKYISECIPELDLQEIKKEADTIDELSKKNYYNFNDGLNLYESLRTLAFTLNRRARTVTKVNYNEMKYKPTFFLPYEEESEMDMMRENLQIQKAFYTFIVQILASYLSEFNVETHTIKDTSSNPLNRKLPFMINFKKGTPTPTDSEEKKIIEKSKAYQAGLTFKKLLKESSKYSTFLTNFCQYHDCIDISKIPYTFIYEYLYFSKISPNYNLNAIDIFLILDQFYGKIKKLDFLELLKEKQEEGNQDTFSLLKSINTEKNMNLKNLRYIYNFSYDEFENFYKDNLRAFINREQEDDKNIFIKEQGSSKIYKTYKRNGMFLSDKILELYINYCNNNSERLLKSFKLIECENRIAEKQNKDASKKAKPKKKEKEKEKPNEFIMLDDKKEEDIKNKQMIESTNKIYATYELIEISDLIEKHLIMEKYFSTYEMMKFSLLNVIAMTISIKNKQIDNQVVIKIMCDFCKVTHSLVRKYMNIYLEIFTSMKLNKWLDSKQCDDCINIIIAYLKNTNTFPTEDTNNSILKSSSFNSYDEIKVDYKSLGIFKSGNKSIREKRAEFYKKLDRKKEEQLIDYIEKIFAGWYYSNKNKLVSGIEFFAKKFGNLYFNLTKKKGDFIPKTPLELYAISNKLLFKFLAKYSIEDNEYIELGVLVLSLLYYFKMDFFISKWVFKAGNVNNEKSFDNNIQSNNIDDEQIKNLVVDIIYILLDLYETIVSGVKK